MKSINLLHNQSTELSQKSEIERVLRLGGDDDEFTTNTSRKSELGGELATSVSNTSATSGAQSESQIEIFQNTSFKRRQLVSPTEQSSETTTTTTTTTTA
ncbi:unnamed protein product [Ambrosiozyma monospora]|uniref:Unnamed protein product n=1 Tax=Ambrosiozyma monospora TaxID=43982 RepID=A0A9W6Z4D5_AMBMO|nr:unnamed protein product [Ambrosiozyma monospora]